MGNSVKIGRARVVRLSVLVILTGFVSSSSLALDSTVPSFSNYQVQSPAYNAAAAAQLSGIYTSCNGVQGGPNSFANMGLSTAQDTLDIFKTKGTALDRLNSGLDNVGPVGMNSSCKTTDEGTTETLTCATIGKRAADKAQDDLVLSCMNKQKKIATAIQGELGCLTTAAKTLTKKIASISELYTKNMAQMGKDVTAMDAVMKGRDDQTKFITQRLTGGATGEVGLMTVQKLLNGGEGQPGMIQGMSGVVDGIKARQLASSTQRTQLKEWEQSREMAEAADCFHNTTDPSYTCEPLGPAVTALELIKCRVRQNAKLGSNNTIERDGVTTKRADQKEAQVGSILEAMIGKMPSSTEMPTSAQDVVQSMGKSKSIMTVADVDATYGSKLSSFKVNGFDVGQFVHDAMTKCYNAAVDRVKTDEGKSSTQIGQNIARITADEKKTQSDAKDVVAGYSRAYSQATLALTGSHNPLVTVGSSNCDTGTPTVQAKCLDDVTKNLKDLANGTGTSDYVQTITGDSSVAAMSFSCKGIDGCIASYQEKARFVTAAKTNQQTIKTGYIQKSNAATDAFTNQLTTDLNKGNESQKLTDRQDAINKALMGLGVSSSLHLGNVQGESLVKGENGLYENPKSVLGLVGAKLNPPMLDVNGESFTDVLKSLAEKTKSTDKRMADLKSAEAGWEQVAADCKKDSVAKYKASMATFADQCDTYAKFDTDQTALDNLMESINNGFKTYKVPKTEKEDPVKLPDPPSCAKASAAEVKYTKAREAADAPGADPSLDDRATNLMLAFSTAQSMCVSDKAANNKVKRDCAAIYRDAIKEGDLIQGTYNSGGKSKGANGAGG